MFDSKTISEICAKLGFVEGVLTRIIDETWSPIVANACEQAKEKVIEALKLLSSDSNDSDK